MGLLDDAIREHLELKRRRGADPSEVAREEAEALGPVRREPVESLEPGAEPVATSTAQESHAGLEDPGIAYAEEDVADVLPPEPPRFAHAAEPPPTPAEPPAAHD